MFKKTRLRLVLLNSIVFLVILNSFGAFLYFYTESGLFHQVGRVLQSDARHLQHENLIHFNSEKAPPQEEDDGRRIITLLWDQQGQIIGQLPADSFTQEDALKFRPDKDDAKERISSLDPYRILSVPVQMQTPEGAVAWIQLVYNMTPEFEMLHHLLMVIVVGSIISVAAAGIAGLYLANKALIPIQSAWNKQQEFVADASHELRTPLSVMQLHMERLFRHPERTIEEESQHIYEVINESKRMNRMVDDLLTLARTDSNQLQIVKKDIQLDKLLNKIADQFRDMAMLKEIELKTDIPLSVLIHGDEERLHQLLIILVDNAIKYTKPNGQVWLRCKPSASSVAIEVEDTGIGISRESLPFVFDRFFRDDKARTRTHGTGLGLSIAKWVVEAHGGKIRAESELGKGSCFTIQLPT